ncbi:MAG: hypothetical protein ACREM8_06530 [Vulcanimicrobiaceae bacterium]
MVAPIPVSVIVDGREIVGIRAAHLFADRVFTPAAPFLTAIAARIVPDMPAGGGIVIVHRDSRIRVLVQRGTPTIRPAVAGGASAYRRGGETFVPLGELARLLGESVRYDPRARILEIWTGAPQPVARMTPYRPHLPVAPFAPTFPAHVTPTPRPVVTGIPTPRRTPVSVKPSFP